MKIKHNAPNFDNINKKQLDCGDKKKIASYNETRKRKIRNMKKNVDDGNCNK
jgi:hypothetical protein